MIQRTYIIGALDRRVFRRSLESAGIAYLEDKGFLDSQYVVTATERQHQLIQKWIRDQNHKSEFEFFTFKVKNGGEANEFEALAVSFPGVEVDKNKGWFKTKFTVCCHPSTAEVLTRMEKNLA